MTPTRHCDDCVFFSYDPNANEAECEKGHKLRFFLPKSAVDFDYGWKRKCSDYEVSWRHIEEVKDAN